MKLLIFGATGVAGGWVIRKAIDHGHEITLHVRNKTRIPADISGSDKIINIFEGPLSDESTLSAAIQGQDAILSAIGPSGIFTGFRNDLSGGYRLILKLMRQHGVRRILAMSTVSEYDPRDSFAFSRSLAYWAVFCFARRPQKEILDITKVFREEGDDLDWTLYRVGNLLNSEEDGHVAVAGWVGVGDWSVSLERRDWANWLIQEVEREEPRWVHEMPVIYTPGGRR
ncbi:hypothetical protein FQN57_002038 [Myotisia sp. PD_48]|nr:hypothetical protein FQN57_002038 [Myotisia sp. PD_48]